MLFIESNRLPSVFFVVTIFIADIGVKKATDPKFRHCSLQQSIVVYCFGDAARCKDCVEFPVVTQSKPVFLNILNNLALMLRGKVLSFWKIIFNALDPLSVIAQEARHLDGGGVHILIEYFCLLGIADCFFFGCCFCFFQSNHLADILITESQDFIRIKSKHILIPDTISNAISMEFIAKNICLGIVFLCILLKHRCAGKAKEDGIGKCFLDDG